MTRVTGQLDCDAGHGVYHVGTADRHSYSGRPAGGGNAATVTPHSLSDSHSASARHRRT